MPDLPLTRNLSPPLFQSRLLKLHSPTSNRVSTYKRHLEFFRMNPSRSSLIEQSDSDDFDFGGLPTEHLECPQLQVLVIQLSPAVHLIVPVYRGLPFYEAVSSNAEVAMIMVEIAKRGGIDQTEFNRFEQMQETRIIASLQSEGKTIH